MCFPIFTCASSITAAIQTAQVATPKGIALAD